ncbi:hypothetical protein B0H13DRAFT_1462357, partial [Mycena leptocephala]
TDGELEAKPWSRPAYRLAMDSFFKILRAREGLVRLNIEIRRTVTWISDEDEFLRRQEEELENSGESVMAILVRKYRLERARCD